MDPQDRTSPESDRIEASDDADTASIAAELLAKLASSQSVDEKGRTALHLACGLGQLETVQLLINHGALIEVQDHDGNTPLMFAAVSGNATLIELLLAEGANINARNQRGQDALVFASISDHADAARLLRERLLALRGMAAKTAASAAGTHFTELPKKKGVFIGGVPRGNGEPSRTTPTAEENRSLAEEMVRSMPLTTFSGWLKQINVDELNPMGLLALDYGFPHFLNFLDFNEDQAHNTLTRRGYGTSNFVNFGRARRFAGDHTLPRGRYYTVCKNAKGDDNNTLQGELWAYYRPEYAGDIAMFDSADEKAMLEVENSGVWKLPRISTPHIAVTFSPTKQAANPFGFLAGVDFPNALAVLLPVSVREERIEKVLDLRQPETARWFAYYFSRLVVEPNQDDGLRDWIRCCPLRPELDSIEQMLPTLMSQERGGGMFCQMVGTWLRRHGVNGMIFPSVRNDPGVEVKDGEVVDWNGWNFVDYRDAPETYFVAFVDGSDYWEEKVRVGIGLGVGQLPDWDPYFYVTIDYTGEGQRRGSWKVDGTIGTRIAIIQSELEEVRSIKPEDNNRSTSWIAGLPLEADVKEWVKLFVTQNYSECVKRGLALLPRIESFEILQMFIISLQRRGKEPAGGGWAANEVVEQLGPQVLASHEHLPDLYLLLAVTLGAIDPYAALEVTEDRNDRCRIHYYAAARLISQGLNDQALSHLDACIESAGEGLEPHLALEERERIKAG